MKKAIAQRRKLRVMGGTKSLTNRPTTALPAQSSGGTVSMSAVPGESFCVMPVTLTATQGLCCHAGSFDSWQSSGQSDFGLNTNHTTIFIFRRIA
jgi:hypothetical protein